MRTVTVRDRFQDAYTYTCTAPVGKKFDVRFRPQLSPKEMLALGVFSGAYLHDKPKEFPQSWFTRAKMIQPHSKTPDPKLNFYGVHASQPLKEWQRKGWIHPQDPRGWFQWYCRYYMGRRSDDDERQIKRWLAMTRHIAQVQKNCRRGDGSCHTKQRQALLHWAYDSRKM